MQYTRTAPCTSICNRRRNFTGPTLQSARTKSWQLGRQSTLAPRPYQASLIHKYGRTEPYEPNAAAKAATATVRRISPTFRVQLIQPTDVADADTCDKLLVYLPGTDGTGQAILPQIPTLRKSGYDVWCLYLPPDDRSDWEQLTTQVILLLRQLLGHWRGGHPACSTSVHGSVPAPPRITVVAESFGCCLALRLAASGAGPELLDRMVLVNPATSFSRSLSGLSSLIAATNLLSLFPRDWYTVAQSTLLPLLVDSSRVDSDTEGLLRSMIAMESPRASQRFGFGAPAPTAPRTTRSPPPNAPAADGAGQLPNRPDTSQSNTVSFSFNNNSNRTNPDFSEAWDVAQRNVSNTSAKSASNNSNNSSPSQDGEEQQDSNNGSGRGVLYYEPAAAANFRANLLRAGDPGLEVLSRVTCPVLLITSARDRLLPSIAEGARLQSALPNARRILLPDSGHAAMLERGFDLAGSMRAAGFAEPHVNISSGSCSGSSNSSVSNSRRVVTMKGQPAVSSGPVVSEVSSNSPQSVDPPLMGGMTEGTEQRLPTPDGVPPGQFARELSGAMTAAVSGAERPMTPDAPLGPMGPRAPGGGASAGSLGSGARKRRVRVRSAGGEAVGGGGGSKGTAGGDGEQEQMAAPRDIDSAFDEWCQNLAPWRAVVSPMVRGFELLPQPGSPNFNRPMLFVGNHQKMGFYDTPLLVYELYVRGYRVRGLAHPGHWAGPLGRWFESFGSVRASPLAAYRLLRGGEKVLLFPGGAKEVVKKRGQEYTLLWKDSPDFVRLAARCNALVVPFAAVGADDAYDVIMDTDEVIAHPLLGPLTRGLLNRISPELDPQESIFPVTRLPGVGLPTPIPVPNLQRLYFQFAAPVDPCALGTNINDPQQVQQLYDGIKATVTHAMTDLLAVRAVDSDSQLGPRLARSLQRVMPGLMGGVGVAVGGEGDEPL